MALRRVLLLLAIGVSAVLAGAWLGSRLLVPYLGSAPVKTLGAGTLLPQRRALTPFALTDTNGAPFDQTALQGRWTLLAFGYASCPDVCPLLLQGLDVPAGAASAPRTATKQGLGMKTGQIQSDTWSSRIIGNKRPPTSMRRGLSCTL